MAAWNKSSRRILIALAVSYFFLCACGYALQRKLLYFPAQIPADAVVQAASEHGFIPWKNNSGQIIGWKIPARSVATGSILIVHGNAGCAIDRDYLAQPVHEAADVDVFVLEYPGYGARPGSPGKISFIAAAEEAFALLATNAPRYVVSESIGAGAACEMAKNHPAEIAGLALFVPYDELAKVAQKQMPFLPASLLLFDRFNPEECLKNYHGPVKMIIAGADEVIGASAGQRLFDRYAGRKNLQIFPGAHHNDVAAQAPVWWREIFAFWQQKK